MNEQPEVAGDEAEVSRNRMIGAIVWLTLLVIVVPIWYSNPVNFQPEDEIQQNKSTTPVVNHPFVLTNLPANPVRTDDKATSTIEKNEAAKALTPATENTAKVSPPQTRPTTIKDKQEVAPKTASVAWIIRLVAYKNQTMAEEMKDRLKYDFEAYVKHFPKSDYYSVRVGPYYDEIRAKKDQIELNRLLRVKSELVKINPSSLEK